MQKVYGTMRKNYQANVEKALNDLNIDDGIFDTDENNEKSILSPNQSADRPKTSVLEQSYMDIAQKNEKFQQKFENEKRERRNSNISENPMGDSGSFITNRKTSSFVGDISGD